jgi:hypothetical protein
MQRLEMTRAATPLLRHQGHACARRRSIVHKRPSPQCRTMHATSGMVKRRYGPCLRVVLFWADLWAYMKIDEKIDKWKIDCNYLLELYI